jgi:hypothetical protein
MTQLYVIAISTFNDSSVLLARAGNDLPLARDSFFFSKSLGRVTTRFFVGLPCQFVRIIALPLRESMRGFEYFTGLATVMLVNRNNLGGRVKRTKNPHVHLPITLASLPFL